MHPNPLSSLMRLILFTGLVEKGQNGKLTVNMFIVVVKTIAYKELSGPRQAKKRLLTCGKCADSDNPAHA